jgi:hypothetical protein
MVRKQSGRAAPKSVPAAAAPGPAATPQWYRPVMMALAAVLCIGWFSAPVSDPDFWWHLKTGQYVWEQHRPPVPDPFAFTTAGAPPAYPAEPLVRHFNLTHEWLAQSAMYLVWRAGGFEGIVLARALLLTALCGLIGWIVWRRTGHFYRTIGAALACAGVAHLFASDRPYLVSYLLLGATLAILESRRWLWALPAVLLVWANAHGGYFLGWIAIGAYAAEAVMRKRRDCQLWAAGAAAVLASGLNPNGFHILAVLGAYRGSYMQSILLEWARPRLWPPGWWTVLLFAGAGVLLWQARRVRISDWLLFVAFAAAALMANRNLILLGIIAPVVIGTYVPFWKRGIPRAAQWAAVAALVAAIGFGATAGRFFQFRVDDWRWPKGAADFLLAHGVRGRLFNTYEYGGYLMWRMAPQQPVFIDGRALSDALFMDYGRILYNHDNNDGQKSGDELLDRYGIDVIVMNTLQPATGTAYVLAPALADPQQQTWKLVYRDAAALVFLRHPPAGMAVLPSLQVLDHMESECSAILEHEPEYPRCARTLGQVFSRIGDIPRARRWLRTYLDLPHERDPEAEAAYRNFVASEPRP